MGLFSSSKSSTSNITTTQNTGFSDVSGPAIAIQGEGNTLNLTDQGALDVASRIAEQSFDAIDVSQANAAEAIGQAVEAVAESAREESENLVGNFKTLAIMGIIGWAVVGFAKAVK